MTARAVICCTRSMFRHNGGNCCDFLALALGDWTVISLHLLAFNRKLFCFCLSHFFFTGVIIDFLAKNLCRSFFLTLLIMLVWLLKGLN